MIFAKRSILNIAAAFAIGIVLVAFFATLNGSCYCYNAVKSLVPAQ